MAAESSVKVQLNSVGNAPKLKHELVRFSVNDPLSRVAAYLRSANALNLEEGAPLFLYVRQSFAPSLDEKLGILTHSFGNQGTLVINYALTQAWG